MKTEHFTGWTVADVMALRPCYSKEKVIEVFDGRETLTMLDVCNLRIPTIDKLWLLTRAPHDVIQPALEKVVARAVKQYALPCADAARAAGRAAAWAEAREAACAAAAWAAAEAAQKAEHEQQLADFRELAYECAGVCRTKREATEAPREIGG